MVPKAPACDVTRTLNEERFRISKACSRVIPFFKRASRCFSSVTSAGLRVLFGSGSSPMISGSTSGGAVTTGGGGAGGAACCGLRAQPAIQQATESNSKIGVRIFIFKARWTFPSMLLGKQASTCGVKHAKCVNHVRKAYCRPCILQERLVRSFRPWYKSGAKMQILFLILHEKPFRLGDPL